MSLGGEVGRVFDMGMKKKQRTAEFFQRQADQEVARRVTGILKQMKDRESKEEVKKDDTLSKSEE